IITNCSFFKYLFWQQNIFAAKIYIFYICKKNIITATKLHIEELKEWFKNNHSLNNREILSFYRSIDPKIKKDAVSTRIYRLVQYGILTRVGRGKFVVGNKSNYIPEVPSKVKTLSNKLKKEYPFLKQCIWTSSLYNEFMLHQPGRFFILVEVEKDATESVFFFMKENKYSVFLEPSKELFTRYIPDEKETWIVKSLVSEAPTQIVSGVESTTIEKLLVDLFCDTVILDAQQGSEKDRIFSEALEKYTVNENKMFRYADRRRKKDQFKEYLNNL
ncbi:MAG: hypothetical protein HN691_11240, partial [Bacteroidetes bacterium]|nr:hypothetical protein [Bacteroidota bacterium]